MVFLCLSDVIFPDLPDRQYLLADGERGIYVD